jgi:hypothetical protein
LVLIPEVISHLEVVARVPSVKGALSASNERRGRVEHTTSQGFRLMV